MYRSSVMNSPSFGPKLYRASGAAVRRSSYGRLIVYAPIESEWAIDYGLPSLPRSVEGLNDAGLKPGSGP